MGHTKSIFIGISIVLFVIIITIITFVYSGGSCEHGTFPCGKGDNMKCVPQHLICSRTDDCRDDYMSLCGLFYGYNDILKNLMITTDTNSTNNLTSHEVGYYDECGFEHGKCFCYPATFLFCGGENLTVVPIRPGTVFLYLEENNIQLTDGSLDGLNLTHRLDLSENSISQLPEHFLHKQNHLKHLFLRRNHIKFIPSGMFNGLTSLTWLMLQENDLYQFPLQELEMLVSLEWLNISHNHLRFEGDRFPEELVNIMEIDLSFNEIEMIVKDFFPELSKLGFLSLSNNRIRFIDPDAFNDLQNLKELRLANNKLTTIDDRNLYALQSLDALFIGNNQFRIDSRLLRHANLSYLNLNGTAFEWIDFTAINQMHSIKAIFFTKFYFCSMTPHIKICLPRSDGLSSDKDLLSKPSLRYSAWIMAIVTCLGNSLVLWGRFTQRDEHHAVSMVIRNLAVSDMLMGFYLSIIGIQDYRFRGEYHLNSFEWIASWSCTFTGTIAMISSEVSLLILTFISIERFLLIAGPFGGRKRLTSYNVVLCLFIIWLIGISIAIIPAIYWRKSTHYYGTYSGICFPLHLQERFPIGWEYSAAIFMVVNSILLITIAVLYIALFVSIWQTQKETPLGVFDYEFAIRFLFVVLVDTACWAPIIAMKVFVFFSYEIPDDVYAFLVVFVLPLNSAVNPILYTFTTTKYRNQVLLRGWKKITSKTWHRNEGSGHGSGNTGSGHTGSGSNQGRSMNSYLSRNRKIDEPLP